jgi:hypothetical protein
MKSVSVMAVAIAVLALTAGFSSVTGSAAGEPLALAQSDNLSVVMPISQELPFDRYWSKD